jgi:two-component system chemotaxis response regulator CheB
MPNNSHIRVLIAEDSPTVRYHLARIINETPGLTVVGEAHNGEQVVAMAEELKPNVISMDINMPRMDGLQATRQIMAQCPTPVVVVSALVESDMELSFQAIQAGALAVVEKPPDRGHPNFEAKQRQLVKTLIAMAGVLVIHRRGSTDELNGTGKTVTVEKTADKLDADAPEVIAIGASAGGPGALSRLLHELPEELPIPVTIVQHMPHEFVSGLARWLNKVSPLRVEVAEDNAVLEPGVVNLSPGTSHLCVVRKDGQLVSRLMHERGPYRYQPSVDVLFQSVAVTCGQKSIGLILTGMGDDGVSGLLAMRQAGAHTFAQDEISSVVFGMPKAAIDRGAVGRVLPLSQLPQAIVKLL